MAGDGIPWDTFRVPRRSGNGYHHGMSDTRPVRNVALIGFMGVGKSTVGSMVAGLLDFELVDTDRILEERSGRRISDIFAKDGEATFRRMESDLVREFEGAERKVISTGGGLPMTPGNLESLRSHAYVVCLWASVETIYQRVRHQGHRPLLHTPDPIATIRDLLQVRGPVYRQADLLLGVDYRSPNESARLIASAFRKIAGQEPRHVDC
jgi:shikimate kinase